MRLAKLVGISFAGDSSSGSTDLQKWTQQSVVESRATRKDTFATAQDRLVSELEKILKSVDTSKDGLMSKSELARAMREKPDLFEQLHVLAVNLAFCPENRMQSDNADLNQKVQEMLDKTVEAIDTDSDGILTRDELASMDPKLKEKLRDTFGINIQL